MTTEITDYLVQLNETDSLIALQTASTGRSNLILKSGENSKPFKAQIDSFNDKKVILHVETADLKQSLDKEFSIKFNIGTEVFFIKTFLKKYLNSLYFDMSSKVIQLKRRKEARYVLPKKWSQTASILNNAVGLKLIKCLVHDISASGIRLEVVEIAPLFVRDDIIKINFQIYKRAEISTDAIVRFALYKNGANPIVGLEFAHLKDTQKERVNDIVEDLKSYNSALRI